jgi:threonine dehydrogenase-like Zn-dependent dehydrogenase
VTGATQRVVTLKAPGKAVVQSVAVPQPMPGEVRVRLQGCGICASNVAVWEGRPWFEYPRPPGSPGHEGWGVVDAVGTDVADMQVGERVAVMSSHAYAEFDVAPRAGIVRLPEDFASLPCPGEPFGCAMNIFERSDIQPGHSVAIVGAGFLGLLLTRLAADAGANVVALSRRPFALDLARKLGATETFSTEDHGAARHRALQSSAGRGFDRVIEAVGLQSTLDLATDLTAEHARLVIAGYHQDGPRQVNMQQWNWRGLDVVNAHERSIARYASGVERAIAAILAGRIDPFALLTHSVSMSTLGRGFELTQARPDGFVKATMRIGQAA